MQLPYLYAPQIFMVNYPNLWILKEAREATDKFKKNLEALTEKLIQKNKEIQVPYPYLQPDKVPTSITI